MKILILYDHFSTHTNTVYQHLDSFRKYSKFKYFYIHAQQSTPEIHWENFDAIIIHYSLRIAHRLVTKKIYNQIKKFPGVKILFVQDEYENTNTVINSIINLKINIVYTCVPKKYIYTIYPKSRLKNVEFVQTLTGYIPEHKDLKKTLPISSNKRKIIIGYRGNDLPYHYGDLGQEKKIIAQKMKEEAIKRNLNIDISFESANRIYGNDWIKFLQNSLATLGTESGSNLFDYDGAYKKNFLTYLKSHPLADFKTAKFNVLGEFKEKEIMNQISPRIFEAISFKTALVLFEGNYSNIIKPNIHFIPLKKDFSNIDYVFKKLSNIKYIQKMVDTAYKDVIQTDSFSYNTFISKFDNKLILGNANLNTYSNNCRVNAIKPMTNKPIKYTPSKINKIIRVIVNSIRRFVPKSIKSLIKVLFKKIH